MESFTGRLTTGDGQFVVQVSGQIQEDENRPAGWSGSLKLPHLVVGKMVNSESLLLDVAGGPNVGIVLESIHGPGDSFYPRVEFQSSGPPLRRSSPQAVPSI